MESSSEGGSETESNDEDESVIRTSARAYRKKRSKNPLNRSMNTGDLSESEKKKRGQITTKENEEESRVEFDVYKQYWGYIGGWKNVLLS